MISLGITIGSLLAFFGYVYYTNNDKKKGISLITIGTLLVLFGVISSILSAIRGLPGLFFLSTIDRTMIHSFLYAAILILLIAFYKKINPIQKIYSYWKRNYIPLLVVVGIIGIFFTYAHLGHFLDANLTNRRVLGDIAEISIKLLAVFTCLIPFKKE